MSKYNAKSKEYTMNYMKENLDEIKFRVPNALPNETPNAKVMEEVQSLIQSSNKI